MDAKRADQWSAFLFETLRRHKKPDLPPCGRGIAYGLSVDARLKAEHDEEYWVSA
jgi:hypothetical protein